MYFGEGVRPLSPQLAIATRNRLGTDDRCAALAGVLGHTHARLDPDNRTIRVPRLPFRMDASKVSPTRAAASKAYAAATKINTRLASSIPAGDVCVVCLHACGTKACACSHMHEQCAASYIKWSGSPLCRVRPTPATPWIAKRHSRTPWGSWGPPEP